jgi:hypothetical protein
MAEELLNLRKLLAEKDEIIAEQQRKIDALLLKGTSPVLSPVTSSTSMPIVSAEATTPSPPQKVTLPLPTSSRQSDSRKGTLMRLHASCTLIAFFSS